MEQNAWQKLRALFDEASALEGEARAAFLAKVRATDATLCTELETLLSAAAAPVGGTGAMPSVDQPVEPRLFELRSAGVPAPVKANSAPAFKPQWAGRYLLLRRLGRGGMAEVFLARAHGANGFERLVAVKRLVADYFGEEELRKRFEREAKVSALLTHPNIVHIYDFEEAQTTYLLAMEYVKGRDLSTVLESSSARKGLPVPAALFVAMQVAEALEYAFTREIEGTGTRMEVVHRDLSPRNVMISFDGAVKLVDFGIARARGRTALTEVGAIRGTLAYLAPEVAAGATPDHRSDLFSLFVVLYEALSGDTLFDAQNFAELLDQIANCTLPTTKVPKLPLDDALKAILARGLSKDPTKRYATAGEVVQALDIYVRSISLEPPKTVLQRALADYFTAARRDEDRANAAALELAKDVPPISLANPTRTVAAEAPPSRRLPPGFPTPSADAPKLTTNYKPPGPDKALHPMTEAPRWENSAGTSDRYETRGHHNRWWVPAAALALFAGVAFLWSTGRRPVRGIADATAKSPAAETTPPPTGAECLVSVETEPPGAKLTLVSENSSGARTPTTLTVPCGSSVEGMLKLEGHETDRFTVTAVNEFQVVRRKLKGNLPGRIELTLSHDATVLMDGEVLAEVGAGQMFEIKVNGRDSYVFRFKNDKLGIDFVDRIWVAPGGRTKKTVNLAPR